MKDYLRYGIYSDEQQRFVDYRSTKKEAIICAKELAHKYGAMTVEKIKTGEIVFEMQSKVF